MVWCSFSENGASRQHVKQPVPNTTTLNYILRFFDVAAMNHPISEVIKWCKISENNARRWIWMRQPRRAFITCAKSMPVIRWNFWQKTQVNANKRSCLSINKKIKFNCKQEIDSFPKTWKNVWYLTTTDFPSTQRQRHLICFDTTPNLFWHTNLFWHIICFDKICFDTIWHIIFENDSTHGHLVAVLIFFKW